MERQDILNTLTEKRRLTAPVAQALYDLNQAKAKLDKANSKFSRTLMFLGGFGVLILLFSDNKFDSLTFLVPALGLFFLKQKKFVEPAQEQVKQAQAVYQQESNKPEYLAGQEGFPKKFYNYHDCVRLYKLIEEHRADDLKEAFNILENQQHNENMMSIQEEMKLIQQDMAQSMATTATASTVAAVASTATAFNTRRRK